MPRRVDPAILSVPSQPADSRDAVATIPASRVTLRDGGTLQTKVDTTGEPATPAPVGFTPSAEIGSVNTGVPDWGILKLADGALTPVTGSTVLARDTYPYYWRGGLSSTGVESSTDPMFNIEDSGYSGGGKGLTHAAFFTATRSGEGSSSHPTRRLMGAISNAHAVVSGIVYPADRGVLALVRWGSGLSPLVPATEKGDIVYRIPAAILLGNGIRSGMDGTPGGIFTERCTGTRAQAAIQFTGNPSAGETVTIDARPLGHSRSITFTAVASSATGYQFLIGGTLGDTLSNLATTINKFLYPYLFAWVFDVGGTIVIRVSTQGAVGNGVGISSTGSHIGTDDFAGGETFPIGPYFPGREQGQWDLVEIHTGLVYNGENPVLPFPNPTAGQVRLLTDPTAVSFDDPIVDGGIPILGGTSAAVGIVETAPFPFGTGGGENDNFFGYRLPVLREYTELSRTPDAERGRFFQKPAICADADMTLAGNYSAFPNSNTGQQIARFRHRFQFGEPGVVSRNDGTYALVHFRTETAFEAFARDGIEPADEDLYSRNMVNWQDVTAPYSELLNTVAYGGGVALPSTVIRDEVVESSRGTEDVTMSAGSYTLTVNGSVSATTQYYSGVPYYVPISRTTTATPNLGITALGLTLAGVFRDGYRTHDTIPTSGFMSTDDRRFAVNQNTLFISLAAFSYEGSETIGGATIAVGSDGTSDLWPGHLGGVRRQRLEFGFTDLTGGTAGPLGTTNAVIALSSPGVSDGVHFTGDPNTPTFTRDARVRAFVRRPLVTDAGTGYSLPYKGGNTADSRGFTIPKSGGQTVLYHSTRETSDISETVAYGNPRTTTKAGYSNTKDISERFLDEVYRYPVTWDPLTGDPQDQLVGPGLPHSAAAIMVPVRPIIGDPTYPGWVSQSTHYSDLPADEAQVSGLPARNPSYTEGVSAPFPSRGMLMYPKTDYSTGYAPVGPDYSALTGDRAYVRVFNAGASRAGALTVKFRLWGIDLTTFAYASPGPGSTAMAILVKLPGLTTWLDAGRDDGGGPSKQHTSQDGAGCLVGGTETFNATDANTQLRYCEVKLNLGTALFLNGEGKCPVAVKVVIKDSVGGRALDFTQGGEDGPTASCRGLVGIEIIG